MPRLDHRRCVLLLTAAWLIAVALFVGAPRLDLWVSALFYDPQRGFWLAANPWLEALRQFAWDFSLALLALALLALIVGIWRRPPLAGVPLRAWGFVAGLYLLGPGLLVNGVLKSQWGRARPAAVAEFGGTARFTPAGVITDQCASNCSFVSGEGAGAAALAISLLLLLFHLRPRLPHWAVRLWLGLALGLSLLAAMLRVATGRHFLSDTVFAVLLVATLALALHRLFAPRDAAGGR